MSDSISSTGNGPITPKEKVVVQIQQGLEVLTNFSNQYHLASNQIQRHIISTYHDIVTETMEELALFREWEIHIREGTLTEELNQDIMDRLTEFRARLDKKREEILAKAKAAREAATMAT